MQEVLALYEMPRLRWSVFTLRQFQDDLGSIALSLKSLVPSLLLVVGVFAVLAGLTVDWVHSKPWMTLGGLISAMLAIGSGFGLAILAKTPTVDIVFVAPFLMICMPLLVLRCD